MKIFRALKKHVAIPALILVGGTIALYFASYGIVTLFTAPSNDRDWAGDQAMLPYAEYSEDRTRVTIRNIRNFTYASADEYAPGYYDKTFDLNALRKVYYIVEPFKGFKGSAHAFLSFEFEDDDGEKDYVSISAEIRKEKGESFSPIKGLFNRYEIMYVIGDERDLVKLRTNYRKDDVYVYPVRTTEQKARQLFTSMLDRANELKDGPEFYNTLFNTCTTNIQRHTNAVTEGKIPWSYKILFPAYSDELAFDLGMIDTEAATLEEARAKFKINQKAELHADSPDFSERIRE